jgi:hypothetical protein
MMTKTAATGMCPNEACPQRDHTRADFHIRNVTTPLFRRLHLARTMPVTPPIVNRKMKPMAHSIGVLNSIEPPYIQEKILTQSAPR